jgi:hypothetical protein
MDTISIDHSRSVVDCAIPVTTTSFGEVVPRSSISIVLQASDMEITGARSSTVEAHQGEGRRLERTTVNMTMVAFATKCLRDTFTECLLSVSHATIGGKDNVCKDTSPKASRVMSASL